VAAPGQASVLVVEGRGQALAGAQAAQVVPELASAALADQAVVGEVQLVVVEAAAVQDRMRAASGTRVRVVAVEPAGTAPAAGLEVAADLEAGVDLEVPVRAVQEAAEVEELARAVPVRVDPEAGEPALVEVAPKVAKAVGLV
jgi:hypothetical protein